MSPNFPPLKIHVHTHAHELYFCTHVTKRASARIDIETELFLKLLHHKLEEYVKKENKEF